MPSVTVWHIQFAILCATAIWILSIQVFDRGQNVLQTCERVNHHCTEILFGSQSTLVGVSLSVYAVSLNAVLFVAGLFEQFHPFVHAVLIAQGVYSTWLIRTQIFSGRICSICNVFNVQAIALAVTACVVFKITSYTTFLVTGTITSAVFALVFAALASIAHLWVKLSDVDFAREIYAEALCVPILQNPPAFADRSGLSIESNPIEFFDQRDDRRVDIGVMVSLSCSHCLKAINSIVDDFDENAERFNVTLNVIVGPDTDPGEINVLAHLLKLRRSTDARSFAAQLSIFLKSENSPPKTDEREAISVETQVEFHLPMIEIDGVIIDIRYNFFEILYPLLSLENKVRST